MLRKSVLCTAALVLAAVSAPATASAQMAMAPQPPAVPAPTFPLSPKTIDPSCVDDRGYVTLVGTELGEVARSLTVVAISVEVAGIRELRVASATCGKAPRPTPVEGHLAETG